jgi:hypothetical protein
MDRMARALGLGGTTEADDELRPNDNESVTQGQTVVAPAAADDYGNILMAARRGRDVAVTQTQEMAEAPRGQQAIQPPLGPQMGLPLGPLAPALPHQQEEYSGISTALKRQVQLIHEPLTIMSESAMQRDIQGSTAKQTAFKEFATNYNQMRVYIAMVGEQKSVTMIHTIRAYYSIRAATNAYQGKVMGFIGDRRAT